MSPAVFLSLETELRLWHCGAMAMEELSGAGGTGLCVKEAGLESTLSPVWWPGDVPSHWQTPLASPVLGESCVDAQPLTANPQFLLLSPTMICITLRGKKIKSWSQTGC